jgi:YggT family protein
MLDCPGDRGRPCTAASAWLGSRPLDLLPDRKGAEAAMDALIWLINSIINIFIFILIVQVIMSWLIAFNVVNTRNRFVYMVADVAYKITEPVLRPIRRILPNFGGIDLSPVVLILLLGFIQRLLPELLL